MGYAKSLDGQDKQKDFEKLKSTMHYPKELCKFKSIDTYSLLGLQTNQLYIPSADKYDDPFDTYLYINWAKINEMHNSLKNNILFAFEKYCIDYNEQFSDKSFQDYKASIENKSIHQKIIQSLKSNRLEIQKISKSISFAEDFKNETLWLKYANCYKGFCLVYDLNGKLPTIEKIYSLFIILLYHMMLQHMQSTLNYLNIKIMRTIKQSLLNLKNKLHMMILKFL